MIQEQNLPGINFIGVTDKSNLPPNLQEKAVCNVPIVLDVQFKEIHFFGVPKCTVATSESNHAYVQQVKLEFLTNDEIPKRHAAFLLRDVQGRNYLIGFKEKPSPYINITYFTGLPDSSPAVKTVEVQLIAKKAMIPCFV